MGSTELLPHLLDLTWDKVPNVRLAVARLVANLPGKYQASCIDLVEAATAQLKEDKDVDVRTVMNPDLQLEAVKVKTEVITEAEPQHLPGDLVTNVKDCTATKPVPPNTTSCTY